LTLLDVKALPAAREEEKAFIAPPPVVVNIRKKIKKISPKIRSAPVLSVPFGHGNLNAVPIQILLRSQVEILRVEEGGELGVFLHAYPDVNMKGSVV